MENNAVARHQALDLPAINDTLAKPPVLY